MTKKLMAKLGNTFFQIEERKDGKNEEKFSLYFETTNPTSEFYYIKGLTSESDLKRLWMVLGAFLEIKNRPLEIE